MRAWVLLAVGAVVVACSTGSASRSDDATGSSDPPTAAPGASSQNAEPDVATSGAAITSDPLTATTTTTSAPATTGAPTTTSEATTTTSTTVAPATTRPPALAYGDDVGQPWGSAVPGLLTFRGNPSRTYYGAGPVPAAPDVLWQYPGSAMCGES
ncbi:MAG: hypothetical protein ACR2HQ_05690, partial [Ilumatobacteraceae bacterium]